MAENGFSLIALGVCVFSVLAVSSRDIFHCAVWLAMTLLSVAGVYFYLDAPFLGVIQVLVYVGGIITLFVFAIKLTSHIGEASIKQTTAQLVPSFFAALILFYCLIKVIATNPWAAQDLQAPVLSLVDLGHNLISIYLVPFEFISLLLLTVMVGAIVIGRVKK